MFKKLIFLTSFILVLALVGTNVALGSVVDIRIATGDDDVEERLRPDRNGDLDMGSSDLEFPYEDFDPPGDPQRVSLRFVNVGIPQGAQITSAYLEFEVDNLKGGTAPVNVIIDGELTPDAAPFVDVSFNVSNRPSWTTALVKWSVPNWTEQNVKYQTPDISVLVQEIVNQEGWAYGNAMVYTVQDDPENPSEGVREAESYNGEADAAPLLHVEFISKVAMQPVPADGAVEVDAMTLEWTPADVAVSHKVYLSTDETIDESDLAGETAVALIAPAIEPGTTYYWRVDAVDADGNVIEGSLWSFSTLPLEAHFPSPSDGAMWVRLDSKLSWTPGKNAIMHNVSFGTDPAALLPVSMMQMDTSYDPGVLQPATTYYWKVDEFSPIGTIAGPVWSFTTLDPDVGGCVAEYWTNRYFIGEPYLVTIESEVNWNFNSDRGSQPHPDVPVTDNFSCRWTAELQVPVTGTYTLYEASDDGARMFLNGEQVAAGWWDRGTTEDTTGPLELVAGERYLLVMEMYEAGGGATAYLRWEGPGIPKQIIPQGALMPPEQAISPLPANGAEEVSDLAVLSWRAGETAILHDVYLGTDADAVAAGDASVYQGQQPGASFVPAEALEWNTTYYWKVDEMTTAMTVVPGLVWSFTVADYIVIETQETTLDYDNRVEPFVSEAAWDTPADLTVEGVSDLTLRFHGAPAPEGRGSSSIDEATGTYTITGAGADIWGNSDQFHYGYVQITGDATITARVVDNGTGSNTWAKGGVMIRQSVDAGSNHAYMPLTGGAGNGASFQRRHEANSGSSHDASDEAVAPPYWVKLERVGNDFSGFISPDGVTWTQLGGTETIVMEDPVLIGLAVTSHQSGELRTFTFDNLDIVGNIISAIESRDIGIAGNFAEPIYVALEDSAGVVGVVTHPDPAATQINQWWMWKIPLSDFSDAGVDLTAAAKLYFGVGDGEPGSYGSIRIDDILIIKPTGTNIAWVSYHGADDEPHSDAAAVGFTEAPDIGYTNLLKANGYNVTRVLTSKTPDVEFLNTMDLVIISRTASSGHYGGSGATLWNSVTSPMINLNGYTLRNSRLGFTDGGTMVDTTGDVTLRVTDPMHPIFAGIDLVDCTMANLFAEGAVPLPTDGTLSRGISINNNTPNPEGTVLAVISDVSADTGPAGGMVIAEWPAGAMLTHSGGAGTDALGGPRLVFLTGSREPSGVTGGQAAALYDLYEDGTQMFLNAVNYMIPVKDVTAPGDNVKGVPDDGDWPGAESPPLAIDDNTGTKYLHRKGGSMATGFVVTPLAGASIVTGLTLTTANDSPGRDPIAFELSGSNVSIDGPYELIAVGDIVDFALEAEWPRFTMNETPISFDNDVAYEHYKIVFPTLRGPTDSLMQIAEVELLGVLAP